MFRYQLLIEYEGTTFRGWQIQKKGKTIQGLIQEKISKILKEKIILSGSGRTDTGVHALEHSAHFECKKNQNFHSRFSAKMRIYKYIIINRLGKPILDKNRGWHIMNELDLRIMKKAAKQLVGTNDFSTFRASSCRAKSPIKTMKSVKIKSKNDKIEIEFQSQSFLQKQDRSMVGCLKYVGEKKWTLKKFISVMNSKKRILCAPPAPPEGLYLARVIY